MYFIGDDCLNIILKKMMMYVVQKKKNNKNMKMLVCLKAVPGAAVW